jgi:myo-inositol 2-dehydrogenase / D-chiro-inositol 1-dehydrogenase
MINVGFIGAGDIAHTHAAAIAEIPDARLVAVTDSRLENAQNLGQKFGAQVAPSLEALIAIPGLDIVYILTPPAVHAQQIITVAQAGLPILCEKPLTLTLEEADQAISAIKQAQVPLMTGLSHRYHPLAAKAKELLDDGDLGDFVAAWSHRFTRLDVQPKTWLGSRALSGGMALQYAMHDLDWECWLGGDAAQVSAQEVHTNPEIDIEDNLWALVQFQNGGSGSVGVSWSAYHHYTERGVIGSHGNLRIINQKRLVGQISNGTKLEVDLGGDYDWFDVFVRESQDAITQLSRGEPFRIDAQDGRKALEISLAVQRAAITRRMVPLPLTN